MMHSDAAETIVNELPWWATPSNLLMVAEWLDADVDQYRHLLEKAWQYDDEWACAQAVLAHRVETTAGNWPQQVTEHHVVIDMDEDCEVAEGAAARCEDCDWRFCPEGKRREHDGAVEATS